MVTFGEQKWVTSGERRSLHQPEGLGKRFRELAEGGSNKVFRRPFWILLRLADDLRHLASGRDAAQKPRYQRLLSRTRTSRPDLRERLVEAGQEALLKLRRAGLVPGRPIPSALLSRLVVRDRQQTGGRTRGTIPAGGAAPPGREPILDPGQAHAPRPVPDRD